jgi:hypothetical protein
VANDCYSPFNTQTRHIKSSCTYTKALLCFPKNLIPWRDSNPSFLVPEADAMYTAPRRQGVFSNSYVMLWNIWGQGCQMENFPTKNLNIDTYLRAL